MPPIEEADYIHQATVWVRTGYDRDDEPVLAPPVNAQCRFVWTDRLLTDDRGNKINVTAEIAVSLDLPTRSLVWFGPLSRYTEEIDRKIYEVVSKDMAFDLLGKNVRKEYGLTRFRGSLPAGTVGSQV